MARSRLKVLTNPPIFWVLVAFLTLVFLTGGGARGDIQSLIILRPIAVLVCGFALWRLSAGQVRANRFLLSMAAAIFGLVGLHLIPLPPSVWGSLPGREIISEIDKAAALGDVWRPLAMVPSSAWNAFYSLFVPLAVLLLGVQLEREEQFSLLPALLIFGLFSGLLGLLQSVGDPQGSLYLYAVTNNGSAVGLFSNRNHQAMLLATLFPMLAVYAWAGVKTEEKAKVRGAVALAAGAVLIPLLLVTGSRSGLIAGLIGLCSVPLLYRRPVITVPAKRTGQKIDLRWALGAFAVLCLGALTLMMSRAEALTRITAPDQGEDLRFKAWPFVMDLAQQYLPFGSGVGSFVEVFQISEPNDLLSPTYFNHAHNDWIEVYMTLGAPGVGLLAVAMFAFGRALLILFRTARGEGRSIIFARLGAVIVMILALCSVGEYPLRTPTLACLFTLAVLWLSAGVGGKTKNAGIR